MGIKYFGQWKIHKKCKRPQNRCTGLPVPARPQAGIQKLHTTGMLEGSFILDLFTEKLRQYYRHRQTLVDNAASYINKMQKAFRLINIRLDSVLRDVMGRSGKDIIEAILRGA
jgi:hypothetical protein